MLNTLALWSPVTQKKCSERPEKGLVFVHAVRNAGKVLGWTGKKWLMYEPPEEEMYQSVVKDDVVDTVEEDAETRFSKGCQNVERSRLSAVFL